MNNRKAGTWLLLIKAQGRPSPESVDCPQLCKTSHLIFLSFNPYVVNCKGRWKKSHAPAHGRRAIRSPIARTLTLSHRVKETSLAVHLWQIHLGNEKLHWKINVKGDEMIPKDPDLSLGNKNYDIKNKAEFYWLLTLVSIISHLVIWSHWWVWFLRVF